MFSNFQENTYTQQV